MSRKLAKKSKRASQAVVFVAFALALASFAMGAGTDNRESTRDLTIALMKAPGSWAS